MFFMYYVVNSEVVLGKEFIFESDENMKSVFAKYKKEHYNIVKINKNSEDPYSLEEWKQREKEFFGGKVKKNI